MLDKNDERRKEFICQIFKISNFVELTYILAMTKFVFERIEWFVCQKNSRFLFAFEPHFVARFLENRVATLHFELKQLSRALPLIASLIAFIEFDPFTIASLKLTARWK
jgi:hypothetical protein